MVLGVVNNKRSCHSTFFQQIVKDNASTYIEVPKTIVKHRSKQETTNRTLYIFQKDSSTFHQA